MKTTKRVAPHLGAPTPKRAEALLLSLLPVTMGLRIGAQLGGVLLNVLQAACAARGQPRG